MPTDLATNPADGILVRDRAGVGLPFSRGLMATSILATGLETNRAYSIAADVYRQLQDRGLREISADDLADMAARAVASSAGRDVAARYLAWRQVKREGRPIIIAMSGASGVGKSTFATRLAVRLGITRVVTTDTIREVLRTVIPTTVLPELHASTFESADSDPQASFRRQARAVCAASAAVARRLATERRSAIIEGAHVVPGALTTELSSHPSAPVVVELLLTLPDESLHRALLTRRFKNEPQRQGRRHLDNLPKIRMLQESLRNDASQAGVPELDVSAPEELAQGIVDHVVRAVRESAASRRVG